MSNKSELLGIVHKLPITDNNVPNRSKLIQPFISKKSVIKVFCTGCGYTSELTNEIINSFPEFAQVALECLESRFVQVHRCVICDTKWRGAKLIDINSIT